MLAKDFELCYVVLSVFGLRTYSESCFGVYVAEFEYVDTSFGVSVADFEQVDNSLYYIAKLHKVFLHTEVT